MGNHARLLSAAEDKPGRRSPEPCRCLVESDFNVSRKIGRGIGAFQLPGRPNHWPCGCS